MYIFPNLEPVRGSMSDSNFCFLTCIHVSQKAGKVIWHSHILKNFPQFLVIHTVKVILSEREVDVFLQFFCFFDDPMDVFTLMSGSSAFSKSSLNIWMFMFMNCCNLAWRIMSTTLLACEMSTIVWQFEHSLALPFFGIGMKTDLYQSSGHW